MVNPLMKSLSDGQRGRICKARVQTYHAKNLILVQWPSEETNVKQKNKLLGMWKREMAANY